MFKSYGVKKADAIKAADWSASLEADTSVFSPARALEIGLPGEVTAMAFDPLQSLIAIGTDVGSLHVWGAEGVDLRWRNRPAHRVKHLTFKPGTPLLACIDIKDTLSVYNLSSIEEGVPFREAMHSMRSVVTCIETNPAHSHLFLGMKDGTVDCYDLDRGNISPYRIRNHWLEQEELLRRSSVPGAPSRRHIPVCTDIKCHPRDLDLLLIAYEGGVVLYSLSSSAIVHTYELVTPPGAAGGSPNPATLFEERRPGVISLAWRPDGVIFVVGHNDGSLCFWDVEDGDKPLVCRTLDNEDVLTFDWSDSNSAAGEQGAPQFREPVFKLAWSGFPEESLLARAMGSPASGSHGSDALDGTLSSAPPEQPVQGTMLTVLGGLMPSNPIGVHALHLPAYSVPPSWNPSPADLRDAKTDSLKPVGHSIYFTPTPPEDFLLLPRATPYYGNVYDPTSIVVLISPSPDLPRLEAPHAARSIKAWTFPPRLDAEPRELRMPEPWYWMGGGSVCSASMHELSRGQYAKLSSGFEGDRAEDRLPLNGGRAVPAPGSAARLEPSRVLVTSHLDLTIRFWDMSARLVTSDPPKRLEEQHENICTPRMKVEFPRPLHHLTVDLQSVLASHVDVPKVSTLERWATSVAFSPETLEVLVSVNTGETIALRFAHARAGDAIASQEENHLPSPLGRPRSPMELPKEEVELANVMEKAMLDLSQPVPKLDQKLEEEPRPAKPPRPTRSRKRAQPETVPPSEHTQISDFQSAMTGDSDGFKPIALLREEGLCPSLVALSNMSFFAAAYQDVLYVIDLRGPDIIFQDIIDDGKTKKTPVPIALLKFTVAAVGTTNAAPRLLVGYENGSFRTILLSHALNTWSSQPEPEQAFSHGSLARPVAAFLLDVKGNEFWDSPSLMQAALDDDAAGERRKEDAAENAAILVSAREVAVKVDINGPRVAREDFPENIISAKIIRSLGSPALLAVSDRRMAYILALPSLSTLGHFNLPPTSSSASEPGYLAFDRSGDFVEVLSPLSVSLCTVAAARDALFTRTITLYESAITLPPAPGAANPLTSKFAAWFGGQSKAIDGEQIDTVLGGPDRPPRKTRASRPAVRKPSVRQPQQRDVGTQQAGRSARDQLSRNADALDERGERLRFLDDRFQDAASAANDLAAQARRIAQQQAAKGAFSGGFAGVKSLFR